MTCSQHQFIGQCLYSMAAYFHWVLIRCRPQWAYIFNYILPWWAKLTLYDGSNYSLRLGSKVNLISKSNTCRPADLGIHWYGGSIKDVSRVFNSRFQSTYHYIVSPLRLWALIHFFQSKELKYSKFNQIRPIMLYALAINSNSLHIF